VGGNQRAAMMAQRRPAQRARKNRQVKKKDIKKW
jgi:hypothetical protein